MNVICIMMDSWRIDYLGCHPYWNGWVKTPCADKLASEGTLFENAYSEGVPTLPARTALFTGRYTFPFRPWQRLENNDLLLSDLLDRSGYTTALIADSTPVKQSNYMMGFAYVEFSDNWDPSKPQAPWLPKAKFDLYKYHKDIGTPVDNRLRERIRREQEKTLLWKSDEESYVAQTVKKAMSWLERQQDLDHIFLWLDAWDPHEPWSLPSPFDTMYLDPNYDGPILIHPGGGSPQYYTEDELECIKALYAGEASMCDKWLGVFRDKVEQLGLFENTLVIFLSDHGIPLGDHNVLLKAKCWPYEKCMSRIPLIMRFPDDLGAKKRVKAFVDTTDIMPTILDFLGVELPPPRSTHEMLHGHSIIPLVTGEKEKVRECAYMGWFNRSWAIRDGDWKYIMYGPNFAYTGKNKPELFNLREDPDELNNLIDEEPELADKLELRLRRFIQSLPPPQPPKPIMKSIGYLQPSR